MRERDYLFGDGVYLGFRHLRIPSSAGEQVDAKVVRSTTLTTHALATFARRRVSIETEEKEDEQKDDEDEP